MKAGRALLEARSSALDDHELFAAVDHLNHAVDLIDEPEQRLLLAEYNLKAAMRARALVAFQAALWYSEMGIKLLPTGHWDSHYELSFNLYSQHYWCKFLLEGSRLLNPSSSSSSKKPVPLKTRLSSIMTRRHWPPDTIPMRKQSARGLLPCSFWV